MSVADDVIEFIETYIRVPEGKAVGTPMDLMAWQRQWLCAVFDNPAGTRRAILSVGRKNAKSSLVAALMLAYLVGPLAAQNAQIYSAAMSREQAALIFALMAKMVRMNADLAAHVVIRDSAREMLCTLTGVRYRALSAEASTAMGTSPLAFVFDELGQQKGPYCPLFDALHSGQGAHAAPIEFVISTQAASDSDFLSLMMEDAQSSDDPHTVCTVYSAPPECDLLDETAWRTANPSIGVILDANYIRGLAEEASRLPSREGPFRNLVLNQRIDTASPFVARSVWDSCSAPPELVDGMGADIGVDLAYRHDLCGFVAVLDNGSVLPFAYVPRDGLQEKSRLDHFDYVAAAHNEHLIAVPGRVVDFDQVAQALYEVCQRFDVRSIQCDPAYMAHFRPAMRRAGFTDEFMTGRIQEFRQGFISMGPAISILEEKLVSGKLRHGDHPILRMCFSNVVVVTDEIGNRKFSKKRSTGRIDLAPALAMAVAALPPDVELPSFDVFFI